MLNQSHILRNFLLGTCAALSCAAYSHAQSAPDKTARQDILGGLLGSAKQTQPIEIKRGPSIDPRTGFRRPEDPIMRGDWTCFRGKCRALQFPAKVSDFQRKLETQNRTKAGADIFFGDANRNVDEYHVYLKSSSVPPRTRSRPRNDKAVNDLIFTILSTAGMTREHRVGEPFIGLVNGFTVRADEAMIQTLAKNFNVLLIAVVPELTPAGGELFPESWNLDRINQTDLPLNKHAYFSTDTNVDIFIIDSGIEASHPEFTGGRVVSQQDFTGTGNPSDCFGHGTAVAALAGGKTFGVARGAKLHSYKIWDCAGSSFSGAFTNAINAVGATNIGRGVVNLSLSSSANTGIDLKMASLAANGYTVVASAGNYGHPSNPNFANFSNACNLSPARSSDVITVGATDINDDRWVDSQQAYGSSFGPCVDVFAPGGSLKTANIGGTTAVRSGTSGSAPIVAGIVASKIAALATGQTKTPAQLQAEVIADASPGKVGNLEPNTTDKIAVYNTKTKMLSTDVSETWSVPSKFGSLKVPVVCHNEEMNIFVDYPANASGQFLSFSKFDPVTWTDIETYHEGWLPGGTSIFNPLRVNDFLPAARNDKFNMFKTYKVGYAVGPEWFVEHVFFKTKGCPVRDRIPFDQLAEDATAFGIKALAEPE